MNLATKLSVIDENSRRIYNTAYEKGTVDGGKDYNAGYDNGYSQGQSEGYEQGYEYGIIPIYHINGLNGVFNGATFPDGYELFLHMRKCGGLNYALANTTLKSIKIKTDEETTGLDGAFAFRSTKAEVIDLSEAKIKFAGVVYAFYDAKNLRSIYGELDFSDIKNFTATFHGCPLIEDVSILAETIKVSIDFNNSKLTKASITSIIGGLSPDSTEQTLTLSRTAVNKAFETSEGANDGSNSSMEWETLAATKSNWTIALS